MINVNGIVTNTDAIAIDPLEVFVLLTIKALVVIDTEKFDGADSVGLDMKTDEVVVIKGTGVTRYGPDDFECESYDRIANLLIGKLEFLEVAKNIR